SSGLIPKRYFKMLRPSMISEPGASGAEGTFRVKRRPSASRTAKSANVPPTSTPIRYPIAVPSVSQLRSSLKFSISNKIDASKLQTRIYLFYIKNKSNSGERTVELFDETR